MTNVIPSGTGPGWRTLILQLNSRLKRERELKFVYWSTSRQRWSVYKTIFASHLDSKEYWIICDEPDEWFLGFVTSLSSSLAKRRPQEQSSTNILQLSCLQSSCDELWASAQWLAMLFSVVSHPRKVDERPNQSARRRKNPEDSFQLKFGRFHFVAASASWPSGESCSCCLFKMLLSLFFVFVVYCCFCYGCRFSKPHCSPQIQKEKT